MKKLLSVFLVLAVACTLVVPAFATSTPTQKEEVVYGILNPDGSVENIYVVNSFEGGLITDYGNYSEVSNMTTSEKLIQNGDTIKIKTSADRFYYQGTPEAQVLPWDIVIKYKLDEKEIAASKLAGKDGALVITVSTKKNKNANPVFYENYMLQVSLALDAEKCTDIVSPKATLANAGKNKVIAHTIMPGENANITVKANVQDFSWEGIEITALPLFMPIEAPDADNLTDDMTSLADAVSALNDGVEELSEGIEKTCSGADKLVSGSADFASGLSELGDNAEELREGSLQIKAALNNIAKMMGEESDAGDLSDFSDLAELPAGLRQLAGGLNEIIGSMQALKEGYAGAYSALDKAIAGVPDADIDPSGLYAAVYGNQKKSAVLDQLMEYYKAAKTVKGTYAATKQAFAFVEGSLDAMSDSIGTIAGALSGVADEIEQSLSGAGLAEQTHQLKDGLSQLSANYDQFHAGLDGYLNGVKSLGSGYSELHEGIETLAGGIEELDTGGKDLSEGTNELNDEVADLPDTIQVEIDELVKQYDKSGFVPVSFVSDKNTNVTAVQFVLKTAPIELPEAPQDTEAMPVKLTFWQKILKLFGLWEQTAGS
ncbi:MAG: YhgE/Pip domain-containing protein [Firmicutes bacterium]|nr:YhgE/Pip domain-containing protein [Bacillota bacterium]